MVSARRPTRTVSSAITSGGGMFPRFTLLPNFWTTQVCCDLGHQAFCRDSRQNQWTAPGSVDG